MGGGGGRWAEERWESPTQTMLDVVDRFQQLDIPHSSIYAEGVGSSDPFLYRKLLPRNIHILTWAQPGDRLECGPNSKSSSECVIGQAPSDEIGQRKDIWISSG